MTMTINFIVIIITVVVVVVDDDDDDVFRFGANYIFINFAVSHTHLDVVPKEDTQVQ